MPRTTFEIYTEIQAHETDVFPDTFELRTTELNLEKMPAIDPSASSLEEKCNDYDKMK